METKLTRTHPGKALHHFAGKLGARRKLLVVSSLDGPGMAGDVHVLDAPTFLSCLPV